MLTKGKHSALTQLNSFLWVERLRWFLQSSQQPADKEASFHHTRRLLPLRSFSVRLKTVAVRRQSVEQIVKLPSPLESK